MQLTPEAKQAITQHWSAIVQNLSLLYGAGAVKTVTESMVLNQSIQFIDGILKDVLVRDCGCEEKK